MTDIAARNLVVVSAGTSQPSTTRMLADRIAQAAIDQLSELGVAASLRTIELAPLAVDVARAGVGGPASSELRVAIDHLAAADGVIASTPVYKAGATGLFKSFVDVLDDDLLIAKPVVLAVTAGSARHSLVADDQLRALFGYLRALVAPTSVFAAPEDWAAAELTERIRRASAELAVLVHSGVATAIANRTWSQHRHQFGSSANRPEQSGDEVDFDTPLMRLAAGGRPPTSKAEPQV